MFRKQAGGLLGLSIQVEGEKAEEVGTSSGQSWKARIRSLHPIPWAVGELEEVIARK